jgi:hypothetical protein
MRCTPTSAVAKSNEVLDYFASHSRVTPFPVSKISSSWWSLKRVCCAIMDTRAPPRGPALYPSSNGPSVCVPASQNETRRQALPPQNCRKRAVPATMPQPALARGACRPPSVATQVRCRRLCDFHHHTFYASLVPPSTTVIPLRELKLFWQSAHFHAPCVGPRKVRCVSVCNAVVTRRRQNVSCRPWRWSPAPGASR